MHKIISVIVLGFVGCANAWDVRDHRDLTDDQKNEIFTKNGLPWPGMGAQVVPASSMAQSIKEKIKKNSFAIADKGYIDEDNFDAKTLLDVKKLSENDLMDNLSNNNTKSTHMRANAQAINTAYSYNGVPPEIVKEIIGFSPLGAYMEGKKGWTGAIEFFEPQVLEKTTCSYSQSNLRLTGGTASIAKEIASYVVNNKLSVVEVIGNTKTGFAYTVEWYDDNYRSVLTCAQDTYSKDTINKVLEMAKLIDTSI